MPKIHRLVFVASAFLLVGATVANASIRTGLHLPAAQTAQTALGGHMPPVERPILDPFRPPDAPWLPGNRGIEYDTRPGDLIRATAGGTVVFAGQVGGELFVTIRHSADLVTTMAFVATVGVSVGDGVSQGDVVATAGESFHFTARLRGDYIDPIALFDELSYRVRLIPVVRR